MKKLNFKTITTFLVTCDRCKKEINIDSMDGGHVKPNVVFGDDEFFLCSECFNNAKTWWAERYLTYNGNYPDAKACSKREITKKIDDTIIEKSDELKEVVQEEPLTKDNEDIVVVKNDDSRVVSGGLNGRYWSPARLTELINLYRNGFDYQYMANKFGKTEGTICSLFYRIWHSTPGSDLYPVRRALERIDAEKGEGKVATVTPKHTGLSPKAKARIKKKEDLILVLAKEAKNKSYEQLAVDFNISISTVRRYLAEAIDLGLVERADVLTLTRITDDEKKQILKSYNEGIRPTDIASSLSLSESSVYRIIRKAESAGMPVDRDLHVFRTPHYRKKEV